jgi:hypothetical protein
MDFSFTTTRESRESLRNILRDWISPENRERGSRGTGSRGTGKG